MHHNTTYNSLKPSPHTLVNEYHNLLVNILMGYKKALTPLLTHWSYVSLALTHWYTSQTSWAWEKSWSNTMRWISWLINSLWPNDAIWQYRSRSTLAQVMGCCLTGSSHYRTNVDQSSEVFCGIFILCNFITIVHHLICNVCSEFKILKLLPPLPGANELNPKNSEKWKNWWLN